MSRDTLHDELQLLERSLSDARAEHAAGDLDDASLAAIEAREGARLAALRAQLSRHGGHGEHDGDHDGPTSARPAPVRRRRGLVAGGVGVAMLAAAVAVAVANPFAPAPRVVHLDEAGRLSALEGAAEIEVADGRPLAALTLYDAVLRLDPGNAEALIESGWLRYEQGLGRHDAAWVHAGAARLARAVRVAPSDAAGHLYDGIVLFQHDGDRRGAIAQLLRAGELPETRFQQSLTAYFLAALGDT